MTAFSKFLIVTLALTSFLAISSAEARDCKKGKPCGNSCIAQADVCHKDTPTSASPTATEKTEPAAAATAPKAEPTASAAPATATKAKNCVKGKACGNACIPKDAVCNK